MAEFDKAINLILQQEGGFVDAKQDRGGATNYGISLVFLKSLGQLGDIDNDGDIDSLDIKILKPQMAKEIYHKYFWHKCQLDKIHSQLIANCIFSVAVNAGNHRSIKLIQKTINAHSPSILFVDGLIGPKTIEAINEIENVPLFLNTFVLYLINFYRNIVNRDLSQVSNFRGWINRAFDLLEE